MNLKNYLEQHENVRAEIKQIQSFINNKNLEADAFQISMHISRLAGIIKIHLGSEDQYLYPYLMEGTDEKVSKMAREYQDEMGGLLTQFTAFQTKYAGKAKIVEGAKEFEREFDGIQRKLEERMKKEETGIYQLIS